MTIAAFFDMDRTVLTIDTALSWSRFLHSRGELSASYMARALWWTALYRFAMLDMETLARNVAQELEGDPEDEMIAKCEIWHREHVDRAVAVAARRAIDRHRERGDELVLLTGSTQYAADVVARGLGIEHVLCTRLQVADGRFTGRLDQMCFGAHKVPVAERWARDRGIDLARSWFYSDSYNDLPMLSRVGIPVAINPDGQLKRHARKNWWRIEQWC
jgi:HAD superfamily hydrolase (TIGR01490 family)